MVIEIRNCSKEIIYDNSICMEFDSISENERLARTVAAAFLAQLDPTLEEIQDVKTAVSEAVTNAIIHGYENTIGKVRMSCRIKGRELFVTVEDSGVGIENVAQAMEALYTSKPEQERSGMGFLFMEAFMDEVDVCSTVGEGTQVMMRKQIS